VITTAWVGTVFLVNKCLGVEVLSNSWNKLTSLFIPGSWQALAIMTASVLLGNILLCQAMQVMHAHINCAKIKNNSSWTEQ